MITLKEFIRETLAQIMEGTTEARESSGANVSPKVPAKYDNLSDLGLLPTRNGTMATMVKFDVAVTAEDSETAKAGGGVRVVSLFRADGELETETVKSSISRISFGLPLEIPKAPNDKK